MVLFTAAMEWHIMQPSPACARGVWTICLIGVSIRPLIQDGRIVTSAAPLGRLGADRVLHVLDALAVPLIVERRKVMSRAEPLLVDVVVAALAGVRLHEVLAGNFFVPIDLRGTGEKRTLRSITFLIHLPGRQGGIFDAGMARPARLAHVAHAAPSPPARLGRGPAPHAPPRCS